MAIFSIVLYEGFNILVKVILKFCTKQGNGVNLKFKNQRKNG